MIDSGARGSQTHLTQISGMKGLVVNPKGEIIELPIKSSFVSDLNQLNILFLLTLDVRVKLIPRENCGIWVFNKETL